jgi:signal transduction histidine kinase
MSNILIVDDEVGMREGCRRALIRQGFQVSTAEHATEALRKLREEAFDLVLLDAMMPGMSGLEFLERLQERDPDIVCVMITGYATVDLATHAMKKGAQGFLPKPFTSDDLVIAVRSGLEERERRLARRRQKEVEDEAHQIERIREEQAKLDAIIGRFLLVVVHELRNPAGAIKNCLQLIRGGYVEASEMDEYLTRVDGRAGQLLSMLDDLLELAHLRQLQAHGTLVPVAVAELLEEVAGRFRKAAEGKGLEFEVQIEYRPQMAAQPGHLRSLFRHLLENAICYTARGKVQATLSQRPGWIVSTVVDTGIGMTTEELTRIFQEFYRSEAAKAETELGTGLGLAIVNQIVQIYQGNIEVESTVGQGSKFTVSLPIAHSTAEPT